MKEREVSCKKEEFPSHWGCGCGYADPSCPSLHREGGPPPFLHILRIRPAHECAHTHEPQSANGHLGKTGQYSIFQFWLLFVQFCLNFSIVHVSYRSLTILLPGISFKTTQCFSAQVQNLHIKQNSAWAWQINSTLESRDQLDNSFFGPKKCTIKPIK